MKKIFLTLLLSLSVTNVSWANASLGWDNDDSVVFVEQEVDSAGCPKMIFGFENHTSADDSEETFFDASETPLFDQSLLDDALDDSEETFFDARDSVDNNSVIDGNEGDMVLVDTACDDQGCPRMQLVSVGDDSAEGSFFQRAQLLGADFLRTLFPWNVDINSDGYVMVGGVLGNAAGLPTDAEGLRAEEPLWRRAARYTAVSLTEGYIVDHYATDILTMGATVFVGAALLPAWWTGFLSLSGILACTNAVGFGMKFTIPFLIGGEGAAKGILFRAGGRIRNYFDL